MTLLRVLGATVVGLAVALVVVASNAASDIERQTDRLARSDKRIAALERGVRQSGNGAQAELSGTSRRLGRVEDCWPEIQTELDTLDLDRDTLFISPSSQVSRVCRSVVDPQQGEITGE